MEEQEQYQQEQDAPPLFLCPISMELMRSPVIVSTGVTYERKNIEQWLFVYNKSTCPATMQPLSSFTLTPNTTLLNLIQSWLLRHQPPPPPPPLPSPPPSHPSPSKADTDKLLSLISTLQSTPFKVTSLKNLHSFIKTNPSHQKHFVSSGGIQALSRILSQISVEGADFSSFRACEESLSVLSLLSLSDKPSADSLSRPECMNAITIVLQRGSADGRLNAMAVLQNLSATSKDQDIDVIKSLLELLSDEISTKLSSRSLDVLIEIMACSKRNSRKAIEAGAVCLLVELLPDSNKSKCEKIFFLLKRLCECPEGRSVFADHRLGVAAVSKKILRVSDLSTKLGVKILWLVCSFMPKEKVIEDMMVCGAVRKLIGLLHVEGRSSTKDKAVKMLKVHGGVWRKYDCFPCEFKEYLKLIHHQI